MEELFKLIIELITNKMTGISLVDEDCGQLEAGIEEDAYPVTFPCVLIGNLEADWTNVGMGARRGRCSSLYVSPSIAMTIRTTDREPSQRWQSVCKWQTASTPHCSVSAHSDICRR